MDLEIHKLLIFFFSLHFNGHLTGTITDTVSTNGGSFPLCREVQLSCDLCVLSFESTVMISHVGEANDSSVWLWIYLQRQETDLLRRYSVVTVAIKTSNKRAKLLIY